MAQLAHVIPETGSIILSSDIYVNLISNFFYFYSDTFFITKNAQFTKSLNRIPVLSLFVFFVIFVVFPTLGST